MCSTEERQWYRIGWINIQLRVNDDVIIIFRWTIPFKTATQLETCIIWPAIGEVSVYYPLLRDHHWNDDVTSSGNQQQRGIAHVSSTNTTRPEAVSKNIVCCAYLDGISRHQRKFGTLIRCSYIRSERGWCAHTHTYCLGRRLTLKHSQIRLWFAYAVQGIVVNQYIWAADRPLVGMCTDMFQTNSGVVTVNGTEQTHSSRYK